MKNIDKMKRSIIERIENMNIKEFEQFVDVLVGNVDAESGLIDISALFDCEKCEKTYGCSDEDINCDECSEKFKKYALSEEK